jgi:hypothetical protein
MPEMLNPGDPSFTVGVRCDKRAGVPFQLSELERKIDQLCAELGHTGASLGLFKSSIGLRPSRPDRVATSDRRRVLLTASVKYQ